METIKNCSTSSNQDWKKQYDIIKLEDGTLVTLEYDKIFSLDNFHKRFLQCCTRVRWKTSTTQFELGIISEAAGALSRIENNNYRANDFIFFQLNERGKIRDIASLRIVDRGVQKVINQDVLLPIYLPTFVKGNSASIKGKGIDWAKKDLENKLKLHYQQYGTEGVIYLFDFHNYFGSIPHEKIKDDIKAKIKNPVVLKIILDFINDFRKLPNAYKDENGHYRGIGLGSEISQTFSLSYLNELDHFVDSLQEERVYYGRYMDDGYVICPNREKLLEIRQTILEIVNSYGLELNMKKDKIIYLKNNSFTFLKTRFKLLENGYLVIKPDRKNIVRTRKKLKKLRRLLDNKLVNIEDVINSYNGMRSNLLRSKNSFKTIYKRIKDIPYALAQGPEVSKESN